MSNTPTAFLIDGMAYVFRAYYAMRPMQSPDGTPIHAVFGLGMTLQKLLNEREPTHIAACFDAGPQTFRNELFPAYKANRGEPPPDLVPQFDLCKELVARMGIATAMQPGFEADDLLATLTARLRRAGFAVVIVTGDKDLAQLLGPKVRIWDLAKDEEYGAQAVPERMGVHAAQVADLLALMGDSVDNIPGVRGVGAKAATALLASFADLDAIYSDLARVESLPLRGARALREKLEQQRELAYLSRELARVRNDAPCELQPEDLRYRGALGEELEPFAERWGLRRVAERVPRR
jgi:DNA polymerase-1